MPTNWTERTTGISTNWSDRPTILNPWYYLKDVNGDFIQDVNGNNILVKGLPYGQGTIWTEKPSV